MARRLVSAQQPLDRADVAAPRQMWRYAAELREAIDYVIARRPTPSGWFDPNTTTFLDQQQQDEYLRAFRDYLFGRHPYPIYPPSKHIRPDAETTPSDDRPRAPGAPNNL
ncbi:hypothetical protein [Nocardia asiatica]|uniref:hypothetical protein n=1 Tax=Nocardia asiatica TaxID=209252 RepID=UPI0012FBE9D2|nr:hypothetical protein [Nocardia asiatica]